MEKVKLLKVYNMVDSNGNRLALRLGGLVNEYDCPIRNGKDLGFRWSIISKYNPMPIRNGSWFCGLPEEVMLSWFKGNGWYLHIYVDATSGYTKVYDLPEAPEVPVMSKSTAWEPMDEPEPDKRSNEYVMIPIRHRGFVAEHCFNAAIRGLYESGQRIAAIRAYRYANPVGLAEARNAIEAICAQT